MFETICLGSSKTTRSCARNAIVFTCSSISESSMEAVSATPMCDRTMQTSIVLASDHWLRLAGLMVLAYSGIVEQMTLAFVILTRRNESRSGTSLVTTTPAMRAMDSQKVATRSAGLFVWKLGIVGIG